MNARVSMCRTADRAERSGSQIRLSARIPVQAQGQCQPLYAPHTLPHIILIHSCHGFWAKTFVGLAGYPPSTPRTSLVARLPILKQCALCLQAIRTGLSPESSAFKAVERAAAAMSVPAQDSLSFLAHYSSQVRSATSGRKRSLTSWQTCNCQQDTLTMQNVLKWLSRF